MRFWLKKIAFLFLMCFIFGNMAYMLFYELPNGKREQTEEEETSLTTPEKKEGDLHV